MTGEYKKGPSYSRHITTCTVLLCEHVHTRAVCDDRLSAKVASRRMKLGDHEIVATEIGPGKSQAVALAVGRVRILRLRTGTWAVALTLTGLPSRHCEHLKWRDLPRFGARNATGVGSGKEAFLVPTTDVALGSHQSRRRAILQPRLQGFTLI